nr:hypothetical protein [Actinomycetales bacterium]
MNASHYRRDRFNGYDRRLHGRTYGADHDKWRGDVLGLEVSSHCIWPNGTPEPPPSYDLDLGSPADVGKPSPS